MAFSSCVIGQDTMFSIQSDMYNEYQFNEPHFMLTDHFDSGTKNVFNLIKSIYSREEKVIIKKIENIIDAEKVELKKLLEKICKVKLLRFTHNTYFL